MDSSNKRITQRPRRPRTVPPPASEPTSLPAYFRLEDEVPRFVGQTAPLASLAVQVRSATTKQDKASAAQRLARQLVRRGVEMREAIGLAEKSLSLYPEPELALELSKWWTSAGDLIRGAALRYAAVDGLLPERQIEELVESARLYARAGQVTQAMQALRRATDLYPDDPRAWEMQGSFGFWSEQSSLECASCYLKAAELRKAVGDEAQAFENLLRAFEVAPESAQAAERLSEVLRERGRPGAADEIQREHLRHGSAAQRAAHHQRAFYRAIVEGRLLAALESGLEAELDVELDGGRLELLLSDEAASIQDFEGLLLHWGRDADPQSSAVFAEWLLALINVHVFDWGKERVSALRDKALATLRLDAPSRTRLPVDILDPSALRSLRRQITEESAPASNRAIREEIALREAARGRWTEGYEVLQPLLGGTEFSLPAAALALVIASRARLPLGRARALRAVARQLPRDSAAVLHAIAAEMLLKEGASREARDSAAEAIEAQPRCERALASQALVALGAPETASSGLLERSLSVLVARAEACALLCRSAADSGSPRLALSWAARGLALRPGDPATTAAYLRHACGTEDPERILEAIRAVLALASPASLSLEDIARALGALPGLSADEVDEIGTEVLDAHGVRNNLLVAPLIDLAKARGADKLLASITERQLVSAPPRERAGLLLVLCRRRLRADQSDAAARALRRALAQGADLALVRESRESFDGEISGDGKLAMLEIEAELLSLDEPNYDARRAQALRLVASARFDMAQDTHGAVQFLLKATDLDPRAGVENFAHYLHHLAGPEATIGHLKLAATQTDDPMRAGKLLGFAAREMYDLGDKSQAFALSVEALERAPLLTEILSVAEASASADQLEQLVGLYRLLSDASLGSYGQRAVHYHAARELDRRGDDRRALEHACLAFEAVPAEGVAFVLMARLAQSTATRGLVVDTLQRVAEAADSDEERSRWLSKAAALVDPESVGRRQRVSILMRAAQLTHDERSLTAYLDALAHLLTDEPAAKEEMWKQFERLAHEALRHATGAHGAELSVLLARAALTHFERPEFSLICLKQAVQHDIEVPDYEKLMPFAAMMAEVKEPTIRFVDQVREVSDRREAPLGGGLARLASKLAELTDQGQKKAEILARAASDFPEDAELVSMARIEAKQGGRDDLLREIESLLPVADQIQSVVERLSSLSREEGLDALLTLDLDAASDDQRSELLETIGQRQEELGEYDDAALTFRELFMLRPMNPSALLGMERSAERQGNHEEVARILKLRSEQTDDPGVGRRLILRRATVLETKLGRAAEARKILGELSEETEDRSALRMLADSWQRAGDFAEAGELWLRVRSVAADSEEADDACFRAASCFFESGASRRAGEALDAIEKPNVTHRTLALEVARGLGKKEGVLKRLIALAQVLVGDDARAGELFLEGARLSISLGDRQRALFCAESAQRLLPDSAEAKLMSLRLQVQNGALKDVDWAINTLVVLDGTQKLALASDREIREYLRARALLLIDEVSAVVASLERAIEDQGARPLLSLALAPICQDDLRALTLYESAVGAELHGFYDEGQVLIGAGRAARKLLDFDRARGFLSAVAEEDPSFRDAQAELEEMRLAEEEEEARLRAEAEATERIFVQEAERKEADQRMIAEEQARRALEEETLRKLAAEETARKLLEEEEAQLRAEKMEALKVAEEEALRKMAEEKARAAEEAVKEAERRAEARRLAEAEKEMMATVRRAAAAEAAEERKAAAERADREESERVAAERVVREAQLLREMEEAKGRRAAAERAAAEAVARSQVAERAEAEKAARAAAQEEARRQAAEEARRVAAEERETRRIAAEKEEAAGVEAERQELLERARKQAEQEAQRQANFEEEVRLREAEARRVVEAAARNAAEALEQAEREQLSAAADAAERARRDALLASAREEHRLAGLAVSEHHELVVASRKAPISSHPAPSADSSLEAAELLGKLAPPRMPTLISDDDRELEVVPGRTLDGISSYAPDGYEEVSFKQAVPASEPVPLSMRKGRLSSYHPAQSQRSSDELKGSLEEGDVDAGLELLERLSDDRSQGREALAIAQRLALLDPGDAGILGRVVSTATRDGNHALALSIRHILGAYGAGDPVVPPPLSLLQGQGQGAMGLLRQGATSPLHEAVALVWEHTSGHYKREIGSYGISGLERVSHSSTTPFGELTRQAGRVLGLERTAVFRVNSEGDIGMQIALTHPPAVIVSGDVDVDSPELRFHFGAMLAAASPEHALIFGCPPAEVQTIFDALALSFGKGRSSSDSRPEPEVTRVASLFWESIPGRLQRRLTQMCVDSEALSYEVVAESSRRVLRRAGLIVCGDLPAAVADACGEAGLTVPSTLEELQACADQSELVADLLRLALSSEYAEIRFRESS